ncbi:hypothetical protein A1Q1_05395 [Trichosporon asahii var. asahii CBS 2479]|uniref:Uncharacterized protein n=1 Tax=Trichosporon asahii var. asahii (strain ATCC 90039 / CBS 2479 / JCM 2466 / KCTC 7840 / NBRC 103889/ NCYC 2677 / UAMH 7654) TaxID=1186058 RepID=J4U750_TRIAS|nr:hypothetical protein A1Q1_05395 [Trichosporon asahii var. asahii CBS 2479]EJT46065.1 hypothetical protein A1Q1_05395 [Trichosporon asahii var. asahii CBS 2479]
MSPSPPDPRGFPCSQTYTPDRPLPNFPRHIACWGARVGTRKWKAAANIGDFEAMAAVLAPAVLDAALERMYDARKPKVPEKGHGSEARQPHPERPGRRTFQDWIDLTTQIVREVYASALSSLPPEYQARAPPLSRVGILCRNTMNAEWSPSVDSSYYPCSYNRSRPIPLEELELAGCDPRSEANFPDVQEWVRVARGWAEPPPYELPVACPVEEIEVSEDEYEETLAEFQREARIQWRLVGAEPPTNA